MQRFVTAENKKWWTLGTVSVGLFVIMLENTVVNVALPAMQRSLHLQLSELEWVVAGYALTFAAFMLTGGKLADLLGRRLIFMVGLAIFTAASLACGLAPNGGFLIGARVVQGLGGALMNPATLSIITATFPPRQRGTAIGIWAGVSAMALAIGPLVGGLLTEHVNWNWIFFINIPIRILGLLAVPLFIWGLPEGPARLPMLNLGLFRNRTFSGANTAMLFIGLAMFGTFFYVSLYMQNVLGYSPPQAGASFLPMTLLIVVAAPQ